MKFSKDQIFSVLRAITIAAGSFFAGKMIFGQLYSDELWQGIVGAVLGLAAVIWGIWDKTATLEMIESGVRSFVVIVGGLFVASGKLKDATLQFILLLITTLLPLILGKISTTKSQHIAEGKLPISELKGVDETKPQLINPVR